MINNINKLTRSIQVKSHLIASGVNKSYIEDGGIVDFNTILHSHITLIYLEININLTMTW